MTDLVRNLGQGGPELDAHLTVLNVSALGEELWPIGLHLIEQFVWTQVRWHHVRGAEEPWLLLVDELWLLVPPVEIGRGNRSGW